MEEMSAPESGYLTAVLIANVMLIVANVIVLAILGVSICRRKPKQLKTKCFSENPINEPFYEPVKYDTPNEVTYDVPNENNLQMPQESEYATPDPNYVNKPPGGDYLAVTG